MRALLFNRTIEHAMRCLASSLAAIALAGTIMAGTGTGTAFGQDTVESRFRESLGNLETLRDQFGPGYRSEDTRIETFSELGNNPSSAQVYRAIYMQWLQRGGPRQGRSIETALDRDPQAQANMSRPPPNEVTSFVTGIDARAVGTNASATGQRFRETVAILQTRGAQSDGGALSGLCTGVLVSDLTVLTAAHCVCDLDLLSPEGRSTAVVVHDAVADRRSRYMLAPVAKNLPNAGDLQVQTAQKSILIDRTRQPVLLDPTFCRLKTQGYLLKGKDLALIYLDPDRTAPNAPDRDEAPIINLTRDRAKAQFAPVELLVSPALRHMTVVGFGYSDFISNDRRYWAKVGVRVPVASATCQRPYAQSNYGCASGREAVLIDRYAGGDSCWGDSGGPAFIRYFGAYYVAGITSRAAIPGRCGTGGVYTLITPQVMAWINWRKRVGDPAF
ncbi:trypsin-like serine protease [Stappia sp. ES.058]|uniref:trypsin-like serine protease n=1 Tax=Stappia sp. ES.058 TaxID=1881061 RepID=UPI00087C98E5|nr:trypsin-like serine protease [Stappia sp. ES.058]SDU14060.1 Trypsin [Stappia sp. ES.058]